MYAKRAAPVVAAVSTPKPARGVKAAVSRVIARVTGANKPRSKPA